MDNHFHFRVKEIHDGLNQAILERTVNIVYDLLLKYFFKSDEDRDSFKVVGSIYNDGIDIEVITPGIKSSVGKLVRKPLKQASVDKSGFVSLSRLSSARGGLQSAFKTEKITPKRIGRDLRPVTDKVRKVERGHLNKALSDDSIRKNSQEFINSPSFRAEYGRRIERFMSEHMDQIYAEIKSPISKVEKNA